MTTVFKTIFIYEKIHYGPFPIEEWILPGADERFWRARQDVEDLAKRSGGEALIGPPEMIVPNGFPRSSDRCWYLWPAIRWQVIEEMDVQGDPLIG